MKSYSKSIWQKIFSLVLTFTFLVTNNPNVFPSVSKQNNVPVITIPKEIGSVRDTFIGKSDKFIIYLQDAHAHPEAQWNNYRILENINKQLSINAIMVEGTTGLVDTTDYINLSNYNLVLDTASSLLDKGYITGEEYFSFTSKKPHVIWGIESQDLYKENIEGFKLLLNYEKNIVNRLMQSKKTMASFLNEDLKKFYDLSVDYSNSKLELADFIDCIAEYNPNSINVKAFLKIVDIEKDIDFEQLTVDRNSVVDRLTNMLDVEETKTLVKNSLEFRLSRISPLEYYVYLFDLVQSKELVLPDNFVYYIEYLKVYNDLDRVKLLDEIEQETSRILNKLCQTNKEKELVRKLKNIDITQKLLDVSLAPNDWTYFKNNKEQIKKDLALDTLPLNFYETAEKRDTVLAKNALLHMDFTGTKTAVLITGGFHTKPITEILKRKQISYIVISPVITEGSHNNETYINLLTKPEKNKYKNVLTAILNSDNKLNLKTALKVRQQTQDPDFFNIFAIGTALAAVREVLSSDTAESAWRTIEGKVLGYVDEAGDDGRKLESVYTYLFGLAEGHRKSKDNAEILIAIIAANLAANVAIMIEKRLEAAKLTELARELQGRLPAGILKAKASGAATAELDIEEGSENDWLTLATEGVVGERYYLSKPVLVDGIDGKWKKRYLGAHARVILDEVLGRVRASGIEELYTEDKHVQYALLTPEIESGETETPYTMAIVEERPGGERVLWTKPTPGLTEEERYGQLLEFLTPLSAKPRTIALPSWREQESTTTETTFDYRKGEWGTAQAEIGSGCDGCLKCAVNCPDSALLVDQDGDFIGVDRDHCSGCHLCEQVCPVRQIAIEGKKNLAGTYVSKIDGDKGERTELAGGLVKELTDKLIEGGLLADEEVTLGDFKAKKAYYDSDILQVELVHRAAAENERPLVITFIREDGEWRRAWLRQKKTVLSYGMGELELRMVKELQKEGYSIVGGVDRTKFRELRSIPRSEWERANNRKENFQEMGLFVDKSLMDVLVTTNVDIVVTGESSWLRRDDKIAIMQKTGYGLWIVSPHNILETTDKVIDGVMERIYHDVQRNTPELWYKWLGRAGYADSLYTKLFTMVRKVGQRVFRGLVPGHRLCPFCPQPKIVDSVFQTAAYNAAKEKKKVRRLVVANTGCLTASGMSNIYGTTFKDPAGRILFGNAPAVASGIEAGLTYLKKMEKLFPDEKFEIIVFTGDGGDADIGLQTLLGAVERGHKIRYFVFNNEAYMNTGGQRSGATSFGARTKSTVPGEILPGKQQTRKVVADYVAQHTDSLVIETNPDEEDHFLNSLTQAFEHDGFVYCNMSTTCHTGQGYLGEDARSVSKTRIHTGMSPLVVRKKHRTNMEIIKDQKDNASQMPEDSLLNWLSSLDFIRDFEDGEKQKIFIGEGASLKAKKSKLKINNKYKVLELLKYFQPVTKSMQLEGRFSHLVDPKTGEIREGVENIVYINQLDIIIRLLRSFKDSEEYGDKYTRREYQDLIDAIVELRKQQGKQWGEIQEQLILAAERREAVEREIVKMDEVKRQRNAALLGKDVLNIEWFGFASWGIQSAAHMTADIMHLLGLYPIDWPKFGPERAGAPVEAYNKTSGVPISDRSTVKKSQIAFTFDEIHLEQPEYKDRIMKTLKEDGILIVNTPRKAEQIRRLYNIEGRTIITADLSKVAKEKLGDERKVSVAALGALVKVLELKGFEAEKARILKVLKASAKKKTSENLLAFNEIYDSVSIEGELEKYRLPGKPGQYKASPIDWTVATGNEAVANAVVQGRYGAYVGYPITPSTTVGEYLSELKAKGIIRNMEILLTESEYAAMSALIGSGATGTMSFTATDSQGLLLMHEALPVAAGLGLPIVMYVANRAITRKDLSIYPDHSDAMAQLTTGWVQLYAKNNQELYDFHVIAPVLWKYLRAPIMINGDGFNLSHTRELLDYLESDKVKAFQKELDEVLGEIWTGTMSPGTSPESYAEGAVAQDRRLSIDIALPKIMKVLHKFQETSGRQYEPVIEYGDSDADIAIIAQGSVVSTIESILETAKSRGISVKVLDIKSMVPFPYNIIADKIKGCKTVVVMDRSTSPGLFPPLFKEVVSADSTYNSHRARHPKIYDEIYGLGGRNPQPEDILEIITKAVIVKGSDNKLTGTDYKRLQELLLPVRIKSVELEGREDSELQGQYKEVYFDGDGKVLVKRKEQYELAQDIADLLLELAYLHISDMKLDQNPFSSYAEEKQELVRYLNEELIEPLLRGNYIHFLRPVGHAGVREGIEDERNKRIRIVKLLEEDRAVRKIRYSRRIDDLDFLDYASLILNLSTNISYRDIALKKVRSVKDATRRKTKADSLHERAKAILETFDLDTEDLPLPASGLTNIHPTNDLKEMPILRALPRDKRRDFTRGFKRAVEKYLAKKEQIYIPRLLGVSPRTAEYEELKRKSTKDLSDDEFDTIYICRSALFLYSEHFNLKNILAGIEKIREGGSRTEGWAATAKVTQKRVGVDGLDVDTGLPVLGQKTIDKIWPIIEKVLVEKATTLEDYETIVAAVYHELIETRLQLFIEQLGLGDIYTVDKIHELTRQLEIKNFGASRVNPYVSRAQMAALEIETEQYGLPEDPDLRKYYVQNQIIKTLEEKNKSLALTAIWKAVKEKGVSVSKDKVKGYLNELVSNGYSGVTQDGTKYRLAGLRKISGEEFDSVLIEERGEGYTLTGETKLDPATGLKKVYLGNEVIPILIEILTSLKDKEAVAKIKAGGRAALLEMEGYPLYLGIVWEGENGDTVLWTKEPPKEAGLKDTFYKNYLSLFNAAAKRTPKRGFLDLNYEEYEPATRLDLEGVSSIHKRTSDWGEELPVVNWAKCINCLHCAFKCPDAAMVVQKGQLVGVDPEHCKSCGFCQAECQRLGHNAIMMVNKDELGGIHRETWLEKESTWQTGLKGGLANELYKFLERKLRTKDQILLGDNVVTVAYKGDLPEITYKTKDGRKTIGGEKILQLRVLPKAAAKNTKPMVYTFIKPKRKGSSWQLIVKPQKAVQVIGTGETEVRLAIESIKKGFEVRISTRFSPDNKPITYDVRKLEKYRSIFNEAGLWVDERVIELINAQCMYMKAGSDKKRLAKKIRRLRKELGTLVPDYLVTGDLELIDTEIKRANPFVTGQPLMAPGEAYISRDKDLDQIMDDIYHTIPHATADEYALAADLAVPKSDLGLIADQICHFAGGHSLCSGCDAGIIASKIIAAAVASEKKTNKKMRVAFVGATGCLEVATTIDTIAYGPKTGPKYKLQISYFHSAFTNLGASISGVVRAWEARKAFGELPEDEELIVVGVGGDGGTHDIGLQALSGAWERGERIFYIEYNNGAYMNTGIQGSSATPEGAATTTTPDVTGGKVEDEKDLPEILAAHMRDSKHLIMTSSTHDMDDFMSKLEQGVLHAVNTGPAYLGVCATCVPGHRLAPINVASETNKLAAETAVFISYTRKDGVLELAGYTPEVPEWDPKKKDYIFRYRYKKRERKIHGKDYIKRREEFVKKHKEDGGRNMEWITARPVVDRLWTEGRFRHLRNDKEFIMSLQQKTIERLQRYHHEYRVTQKADKILRTVLDIWKQKGEYEDVFHAPDADDLKRDLYADIDPKVRPLLGQARRFLVTSEELAQITDDSMLRDVLAVIPEIMQKDATRKLKKKTEKLAEKIVDSIERFPVYELQKAQVRQEAAEQAEAAAKVKKEKPEKPQIVTEEQKRQNQIVLSNELVTTAWKSRGGKGAVTVNKLFAEMLLYLGGYEQDFPFFGPERQGAPVEAFLIASGKEIRQLGVPPSKDFTIVLDEKAWKEIEQDVTGEPLPKFLHGQAEDGVLLVNTKLTPEELRRHYNLYGRWDTLKIYTIDATKITVEHGGLADKPNTTLLGAALHAFQYFGIQYNKEELFKMAEIQLIDTFGERNGKKLAKAFNYAHENLVEEKHSPKTHKTRLLLLAEKFESMTAENFPEGVRMDGNGAAAKFYEEIAHYLPLVYATYPITPTTQVGEIVSALAKFNPKLGRKLLEYLRAESEHSAMSACIAAALSGSMAGFATGSQGLAYAWEALALADDLRAPGLVVYCGNREINAPLNILYGRSDSDTLRRNWLKFIATNQQEVYDFGYIATLASYLASRPAQIDYAGFFISHTGSNVELLSEEAKERITDKINGLRLKYKNIIDDRKAWGYVAGEKTFPERLYGEDEAHRIASQRAILDAFEIFGEITGRKYDYFKEHKVDDAEQVVGILGAHGRAVEKAVDELREEGINVGLFWPRVNGPFVGDKIGPKDIAKSLGDKELLQIIEHFADSGELYSPFASQLANALYYEGKQVPLMNWIMAVGGRTLDVSKIKELVKLGIILGGSTQLKVRKPEMDTILGSPEVRMVIKRLTTIYKDKLLRNYPHYTELELAREVKEYRDKITGYLAERDYIKFLGGKEFADIRRETKELEVKFKLIKLIEINLARKKIGKARGKSRLYLAKVLYYLSRDFHDQERVVALFPRKFKRPEVVGAALLCMDSHKDLELELTSYRGVYKGEEQGPHTVGYHAAYVETDGGEKVVALNPTYVEYVRKKTKGQRVPFEDGEISLFDLVIRSAIFHEQEEKGDLAEHHAVLGREKEKFAASPIDPAYSIAQHYAILCEVEEYGLPRLTQKTKFIHQYYRRWLMYKNLLSKYPIFNFNGYKTIVKAFYNSKDKRVPANNVLLSDLDLFLRDGRLLRIGDFYIPLEDGFADDNLVEGMNHGISAFAEKAAGFVGNSDATFKAISGGVSASKVRRAVRAGGLEEIEFEQSQLMSDLLYSASMPEIKVKKGTTKKKWLDLINRLLLINRRQNYDPYSGEALSQWREDKLGVLGKQQTLLFTLEALEDNIYDASARAVIERVTKGQVKIVIATTLGDEEATERLANLNFPTDLIGENVSFINYSDELVKGGSLDATKLIAQGGFSTDSLVVAYNDKLRLTNLEGLKAVQISHGVSIPQAFTFIIGLFTGSMEDVIASLKKWLQEQGFSIDEIEEIVKAIPETGVIIPLPKIESLTDKLQSDKSDRVLISA